MINRIEELVTIETGMGPKVGILLVHELDPPTFPPYVHRRGWWSVGISFGAHWVADVLLTAASARILAAMLVQSVAESPYAIGVVLGGTGEWSVTGKSEFVELAVKDRAKVDLNSFDAGKLAASLVAVANEADAKLQQERR